VTADSYLQAILKREVVDTGIFSPVRNVQTQILPAITEWASDRLVDVSPSGSFAKGTANKSGTDIDLFISLSEDTTETLKEIYEKLFTWLTKKGTAPSARTSRSISR
jgi:tRNA nucleotidyltransferase (CCA-adding enzyme)